MCCRIAVDRGAVIGVEVDWCSAIMRLLLSAALLPAVAVHGQGYYAENSGGYANYAYGSWSTVGGGGLNTVYYPYATCSGGWTNYMYSYGGTIIGLSLIHI